MGRCIVDALLTVDPRLGLAARWRRRPADDGAGRRRLVFLCGGGYRVELQTKVHMKVCNHGGGPY